MSFEVVEVQLPPQVDDDFRAQVDLGNTVDAHILGTDVLSLTPDDLLPLYRDSDLRRRRHAVARRDGVIVGRGIVTLHRGKSESGGVVQVHPDHRGIGIGSELLRWFERVAAEEGRTSLQCDTPHAALPGDKLLAATGFGSVSVDDPGVRFLSRHGYRLEQVNRTSVVAVSDVRFPTTPLGDPWRLHRWAGPTPERWLEELAVLKTAMSTAVPSGELTLTEVRWSADDVRDRDRRMHEGDRVLLTCVAEHLPSGRLAGFTEYDVPPGPQRPALQWDTLVLPEFRGHRLGTHLKAANFELLRERFPEVPQLLTWNAEENVPMLAVNEAMGFEPIGYEGIWQKRL